jgi:hypothetical protein
MPLSHCLPEPVAARKLALIFLQEVQEDGEQEFSLVCGIHTPAPPMPAELLPRLYAPIAVVKSVDTFGV